MTEQVAASISGKFTRRFGHYSNYQAIMVQEAGAWTVVVTDGKWRTIVTSQADYAMVCRALNIRN